MCNYQFCDSALLDLKLSCFAKKSFSIRVDRNKYQIQIPLPPKIDPSVTMMTVEEKPDVTYNDVGGCKEQIEKMREVLYFFPYVEIVCTHGVGILQNLN